MELGEFNYYIIWNLPVIIALIMLCWACLYILQNELETANQVAGYAYYLLIIGLVWKTIQFFIKGFQLTGKLKRQTDTIE